MKLSWVLAMVVLGACTRADRAPTPVGSSDPTAPDYVAPPLPTATIALPDAYGGTHPLQVELATTSDQRERGLMWRTSLAAGQGMLFLFPEEEVQSFWMRNTLIPLDMIFIAQSGRIVGIVENAEPRTLSPRTVDRPSKYVLEVPGGWVERAGIRAGSLVQLGAAASTPAR